MKTLSLSAALLLALTAHAASESRIRLTAHRTDASFPGTPLLICEYAGDGAKFEILAQSGKCAPHITVR